MLMTSVKAAVRKGARSLGVVVAKPSGMYREWEPFDVSRFLRLYDVDLVLDIGANAGRYATMLRERVGYQGRIVSCEPNPKLVGRLRRISAADDRWSVEHCAVSHEQGVATLNLTASDEMSSLARPTSA